jgi:hypothetical protein
MKFFTALFHLDHWLDRELANVSLGIVHELHEAFIVLFGHPFIQPHSRPAFKKHCGQLSETRAPLKIPSRKYIIPFWNDSFFKITGFFEQMAQTVNSSFRKEPIWKRKIIDSTASR